MDEGTSFVATSKKEQTEIECIAGISNVKEAQGLEQEVFRILSQQEGSDDIDSTQGDGSNLDRILNLERSIKHGELTPFEVLAKNSAEPPSDNSLHAMGPSTSKASNINESDSDYAEEDEEVASESDWEDMVEKETKKKSGRVKKRTSTASSFIDDGDDSAFEQRLKKCLAEQELIKVEQNYEEEELKVIKRDLKVSSSVWNKLYRYQKTGVRWMSELCEQHVGGLLADEMGLGKTVQTAVFLRALAQSERKDIITGFTGLGPSLLVCPATLLQQWVAELHMWHPLCRVAILHSCGSHRGHNSALIRKMNSCRKSGCVLVTSYSTFYKERKQLTRLMWHYVILDEGHKIRNPEARITMAVKEVQTPYRLLLSGSPMQNSLKELWSLVDFVFPGRLGSLKTFMEKFSIPITIGGYANATTVQTETAYKCAVVLRDAINPYLLRRMKKDVQMTLELPSKCEQVLFCDLTHDQRKLYVEVCEWEMVRSGKLEAFSGLIQLRKICNHPDLVTGGPNKHGDADLISHPHLAFGWPERSGKAMVVRSLLQLWKKGGKGKEGRGNKVLLFSQSRRMLTLLEELLILDGHSYVRMDGGTPIARRQSLVSLFNGNDDIYIFLLTTRVGGVGVNLTGANKVLIFDPDWNPSTDAQARERAWRIGQDRDVTVYRLLTAGTIEEKMYHRQIFKQFLTNRVLKDPKQRRFFKTNHLHDLFTLNDAGVNGETSTGALFSGETQEITKDNFFDKHFKERMEARKDGGKKAMEAEEEEDEECAAEEGLSDQRREELRRMAAVISKDLSKLLPVKRKRKREEGEVEEGKEESDKLFEKKYVVPFLKSHKKAKKDKTDKVEGNGDDFVLSHLLKKNGVRSVVRHDDVVGETKRLRDEGLAEREADTVARQAAAAIRRRPSFDFLRKRGIQGPSTAEKEKIPAAPFGMGIMKRPGDSAGSLLESIRERKAREGSDQALPEGNKYARLAEEMKEFMRDCLGRASSEKIIEKFKVKVSSKDNLHFRSILKQIARFDSGDNQWIINDEFA